MKTFRLRLDIEDELTAQNIYEAWEMFNRRVREGFYGPAKEHIEEGYEVEDDFREYPPQNEQQQSEPEPRDTRRQREVGSLNHQWPWKPGTKAR